MRLHNIELHQSSTRSIFKHISITYQESYKTQNQQRYRVSENQFTLVPLMCIITQLHYLNYYIITEQGIPELPDKGTWGTLSSIA